MILFLILLGLIVEQLPSTKAEKDSIKRDLWKWEQSLNNPSLGGAAHDLHTGAMLVALKESGARWGFDQYNFEKFPEHVTLIGWVDPGVWKNFYYKDKRLLLVDLEWSLQENTHQMQVKRDELGRLPFTIEIRDTYGNKLLAKRSQSLMSDRFEFYE
jgi:hypothetical protein